MRDTNLAYYLETWVDELIGGNKWKLNVDFVLI